MPLKCHHGCEGLDLTQHTYRFSPRHSDRVLMSWTLRTSPRATQEFAEMTQTAELQPKAQQIGADVFSSSRARPSPSFGLAQSTASLKSYRIAVQRHQFPARHSPPRGSGSCPAAWPLLRATPPLASSQSPTRTSTQDATALPVATPALDLINPLGPS